MFLNFFVQKRAIEILEKRELEIVLYKLKEKTSRQKKKINKKSIGSKINGSVKINPP